MLGPRYLIHKRRQKLERNRLRMDGGMSTFSESGDCRHAWLIAVSRSAWQQRAWKYSWSTVRREPSYTLLQGKPQCCCILYHRHFISVLSWDMRYILGWSPSLSNKTDIYSHSHSHSHSHMKSQWQMTKTHTCHVEWATYYTPHFNEVERVYTYFTLSVRPPGCPSEDKIVFDLYLQQYSPGPFHIYISYL